MKRDWRLSHEKLVEILTMLNAMAAMRGSPCPVSCAVLHRIRGW